MKMQKLIQSLVQTCPQCRTHISHLPIWNQHCLLRGAQERSRKGEGCRQWVQCLGKGNSSSKQWAGVSISLFLLCPSSSLCIPCSLLSTFLSFILCLGAFPSDNSGGVWFFWPLPPLHYYSVCRTVPLNFSCALFHSPSQLLPEFEPPVVLQPTKITFRVTFPPWQRWTKLPAACVGLDNPLHDRGEGTKGAVPPMLSAELSAQGLCQCGGPSKPGQSVPYPAVGEERRAQQIVSPGHPSTNLLPGALDRDWAKGLKTWASASCCWLNLFITCPHGDL